MNIHKIPTGYLFTDNYSKGQLETLSIGDYGKSKNVKADFLGLTNCINGVPNDYCIPLQEKWVITISTQYGCQQLCRFCDCHKIKFLGNATFDDIYNQFRNARNLFPNVEYTERLNCHYARQGEPIFNTNCFEFSRFLQKNKKKIQEELNLRIEVIHPVMTTSMPNYFNSFQSRVLEWCEIKNDVYNGQAGLQFSINSTNEKQRQEMFAGKSLTLEELSKIAEKMPDPISRKYCLNFAYSTDFEIDGTVIAKLFDPNKFMCKITPIHNNNSCRQNNIKTENGYVSYHPYLNPENSLKENGFDVLVFIPSMDEESGAVTCGNLILGGSNFETTDVLKISGQTC